MPRGVFRGRRPVRAWIAWAGALAVAVVAVVLGIAAGQHSAGVALIIAFPVALVAYRYVLTGRLVALYDDGLVAARRAMATAVRWDDIERSWRGPRSMRLSPRTGAPASGDVTLRGLARLDELMAAIDVQVQPRALARARAGLSQAGRASFPPLAVTADGLRVLHGQAEDAVPWSQVDAYSRTGDGRLLIDVIPADGSTGQPGVPVPWFSGLVPDVIAAERLMDETDPASEPASAERLVATDVVAGLTEARQRAARGRAYAVVNGTLAAVLLIASLAFAGVSRGGGTVSAGTAPAGLQGVCDGTPDSLAAPYTGPGPHPVDFEGDAGATSVNLAENVQDGTFTNNAGPQALPGSWVPAGVSDTQMVACISTGSPGDTATTCQYVVSGMATLYYQSYTIRLWEARTGTQLGVPVTLQGNDTTCPRNITYQPGQPPPDLYSSLTAAQVQQAIGKYVNGP